MNINIKKKGRKEKHEMNIIMMSSYTIPFSQKRECEKKTRIKKGDKRI